MQQSKQFWRGLFFILLITALCGGLALPSVMTPARAAPQMQQATIVPPLAVVINEIAWGGTGISAPGHPNDEWIELYNPTGGNIPIDGWRLTDGTDIYVVLAGSIPSHGYFLLGSFSAIFNDVTINQVFTGSLNDSGERIHLLDPNGNLVDTANSDQGAWPAGTGSPTFQSMERRGVVTDAPNAWMTYGGTAPVAHDRDGNPVRGTPGQQNWISTSPTVTIISDNPDPSLVNTNVIVSVEVRGSLPPPSGTVRVTAPDSTGCTITLVNGGGNCTLTFSAAGSKQITASYSEIVPYPGPPKTDTEPHEVVIAFTDTPSPTATRTPTRTRTPTPIRTATRTRTPSRTPSPQPPPPLIAINEFVPRPGHDWNGDGVVNVGDEFIELLNHGVIDVNLSGYALDDEVNIGSSPYRLPSITLKPGERRVFYGSDTGLLLSDGGDGVRLIKPNGQLGDAYNYFVVRFPDQSYCRLPDNGGLDDWNQNCFATPGLQNSLAGTVNSPSSGESESLCPISDTLPNDFTLAECPSFGSNIWNPDYWDRDGWYDEKFLPESPPGKWNVFVD